jgi:subtilisin family serine protease
VRCPAALLAPLALLVVIPTAGPEVARRTHIGVTFASRGALLRFARANDAAVVRVLPELHVAVVSGDAHRLLADARRTGGITATPLAPRRAAVEPSLEPDPDALLPGADYEWQWAATHMEAIPEWVLRAAAAVPVAVVDTGADLRAPDLAAKRPVAHSVLRGGQAGDDVNGHGTFVASIAAGSPDNGDGLAGFAGDAPLLVVQAGSAAGTFTEVDEAAAIVWAVDHGAKIVNMSFGGARSSPAEGRAVAYAQAHGVLLVASAGNEHAAGNPVEYPAALLQPVGSDGAAGAGLVVGGTDEDGARAWFASSGSWISLAAPATQVLGSISSRSESSAYRRVTLPGARAGRYGFASGTSFAAPQVAGAAALVWAANPTLTASQVATILERTASGAGTWNEDTGFGLLDGGAAVAAATATLPPGLAVTWLTAASAHGILRAQLHASAPGAAFAGLRVTLDRAVGPSWRVVGTREAAATGAATWKLERGGHYRVRFAGAPGLTAATTALP